MLWEGVKHISGIANPHIQDPRIANPLGREQHRIRQSLVLPSYEKMAISNTILCPRPWLNGPTMVHTTRGRKDWLVI